MNEYLPIPLLKIISNDNVVVESEMQPTIYIATGYFNFFIHFKNIINHRNLFSGVYFDIT